MRWSSWFTPPRTTKPSSAAILVMYYDEKGGIRMDTAEVAFRLGVREHVVANAVWAAKRHARPQRRAA